MPDGTKSKPWSPPSWFYQSAYRRFAESGGQGYTADGLFHFFGRDAHPGHDWMLWNEGLGWRSTYLKDMQWRSIAEDAFGYQFCMRADGKRPVVKVLSLWDGSFTLIANSFEHFAETTISQPDSWASMKLRYRQLAKQPSMQFRPLQHLTFTIPPLMSATDEPEAFEWADSVANVSILSQVYSQLRTPDT